MSLPGHRRVQNTDPIAETARMMEAESSPTAQKNNVTIPGYVPPSRPPAQAERSILFESAPPANGGEDQDVLPDVAVASMGDATMLEVVLGRDDRVRVASSQVSQPPWRMICALRIKSRSGRMYVGTAWFIAPKVLATAGHCVFLHDDGGWAESITVIPRKDGNSEPLGKLNATRFGSVDGWTVNRSRDFDYGVIFLDDATAGNRLGNFEVLAFTAGELNNVNAKISGYPADRDRAEFQYFHERPLQQVTDTRLVYDVDTFGGQSGSPIWLDTQQFGLAVMGIHTNGGVTSNSGTRITNDVLDNLIAWSA
jgi:glutamyl endopeptidase